jgi:acyl-CoA thioester hydrolase
VNTGPDRRRREATFTKLRVRYPEADRMGVAYHANYLVWFEMGRTELMREAGCAYRELEERDGVYFPVIRAGVRYLAPARYDDRLEVAARITAMRGVRIRFEYELRREDDGDGVLATGFTEHAAVGRDGRPRRMPGWLKQRLRQRESGNR